eukprot:3093520-Alexandrium_andersonii.AAC.1
MRMPLPLAVYPAPPSPGERGPGGTRGGRGGVGIESIRGQVPGPRPRTRVRTPGTLRRRTMELRLRESSLSLGAAPTQGRVLSVPGARGIRQWWGGIRAPVP